MTGLLEDMENLPTRIELNQNPDGKKQMKPCFGFYCIAHVFLSLKIKWKCEPGGRLPLLRKKNKNKKIKWKLFFDFQTWLDVLLFFFLSKTSI